MGWGWGRDWAAGLGLGGVGSRDWGGAGGRARAGDVSNIRVRNTDLVLCSTVSPYKFLSRWLAQGNRKMNPIVMLKDLEVTEPRGHAGQARTSFRAYA